MNPKHILVVDDEPLLLNVMTQLLEYLGYRVTATARAAEALAQFMAAPDQFDVVLLDRVMPQVNGPTLARAMRGVRGDISILFLSGVVHAALEQEAADLGVRGILPKPFTKDEISEAVRKALEPKAP